AAIGRSLIHAWQEAGEPGLVSYQPMPEEASPAALHAVVWASGRAIHLPRVVAPGALCWHRVCCTEHCRPGRYGLLEPTADCETSGALRRAWVLVPGTAFDRSGNRLGMGGGFYDRELQQLRQQDCHLIGLLHAEQLLEAVPMAAHDQRVHVLCCDGDWITCRNDA
ncbi:MAG: 5-formyltetrahydrofolate cyclo-ligase, partial [Planctomycetota bacterium]